MCNYVQKNIYFEKLQYVAQNWFRLDTKIMGHFVQKSLFVQKRETVAQGNPLWKPYSKYGLHDC